MRGRPTLAVFAALSTLAGLVANGCGRPELVIMRSASRVRGSGGTSAGGAGGSTIIVTGGASGSSMGFGGTTSNCSGYDCDPVDCGAGKTTSVSGTVYDPAGKVPLYNVVVYVPDVIPNPIDEGLGECVSCLTPVSGRPIAATLSKSDGTFKIDYVPPGDDIPLVIQIGKWRRQISIPHVAPCTNNPIDDKDLTRLPRNHAEGHIPQIGVTTGHSDALECLLRKIGIDDSEFSTDAGTGRVHMYVGCGNDSYNPVRTGANRFSDTLFNGAIFPAATTLWATTDKLKNYDILLFSCEGNTCSSQKLPYIGNIKWYADAGGRLFLDHTHYYWLNHNVDAWQSSADYVGNGGNMPDPFTTAIDRTFPKGEAFSEWLVNVGATSDPNTLEARKIEFSVRDAYPPMTQQWIYTHANPNDSTGHAVEYMTMNTPVELAGANAGGAGGGGGAGGAGVAPQCGRVVYTDLHVATVSKDRSDQDAPFPTGCDPSMPALTPQEKALEFMFFDLSSCVQPEHKQPHAPDVFIK